MGAGHDHALSPAARNQRRLVLVLVLTGTFLLAEVAAGSLTGSLALLADAGHMLTDAGGLVLALVGIRLAQRPATPEVIPITKRCLLLSGSNARR